MRRPKYWIIADTHFNHVNIAKFCMRPADFEMKILEGLKVIKDDDVLIHLGDFALGNEALWSVRFFNACKARRKWLVLGNHDSKSITWYLDHGWDWVGTEMVLDVYGEKILFTHEPVETFDRINIHGHLHNNLHKEWEERIKATGQKSILVSLEDLNYMPVELETLLTKTHRIQGKAESAPDTDRG